MGELRKEIESAVNRCSAENGSNTPDFILAKYLMDCLSAFDAAVDRRDDWYGIAPDPNEPHAVSRDCGAREADDG